MLTSIAALSYATAAVAFTALFILLLTGWRGRVHGKVLAVACILTAIWAATSAYWVAREVPIPFISDILEIARNAGWTAFLILLLGTHRQEKSIAFPFAGRPSVTLIAALYLSLLFMVILLHGWLSGALGFVSRILGPLTMAVIGMILVEQLYRNTPSNNRWGVKYLCLGIGGIFAYDFYLYSDAMLFRHVNPEIWAARGMVNALIVPLIAISAARNPQWSLGISVSRRIIFHSAALFGAAIYLLIMAATGYLLRFFGGSWGAVLQTGFMFGAAILLIGALFSGTLRSRLKVFISKHFYSYNYDYREEWLRFTNTLSDEGHVLGERSIQALADLVESPGGALWITRESGNCEFASRLNMATAQVNEPTTSPFCKFLENKKWVIDLQEYGTTPEKYEALALPPWLAAIPKARLVVPLIQHHKLFGFVVLAQPRSKIKLNWEVLDLLKVAGNQAASYLAQQEAGNALLVARQFESFNRMSTFVVHDLKNLVSQLSLLIANAEKHKNNPEFQKDMIDTVNLSVEKMKRLLHKLSSGNFMEKPAPLLIEKLLQQAVEAKSGTEPKPMLEIKDSGLEVLANWSSLERVVGHLIQNAIEATPKNGSVMLRLARGGADAIIEIMDTGHGMSEQFIRERLFKPFESTKPAGMGIGVFECREYIQELGGRIEVESTPSTGTVFRIFIPTVTEGGAVEAVA